MSIWSTIILSALYVLAYAGGYINGQIKEGREHLAYLRESSKRSDELTQALAKLAVMQKEALAATKEPNE